MTAPSREEALITRLRSAEACGENRCRVMDADSGCICTEAANAVGALLARLSEVERERDDWKDRSLSSEYEHQVAYDALKVAESRLSEVEKALEPFAAFAEHVAKEHPGWDHDGFQLTVECAPTMAAFRQARAALQHKDQQG